MKRNVNKMKIKIDDEIYDPEEQPIKGGINA